MTNARKLEIIDELKRLVEHHPIMVGKAPYKQECLAVLDEFREELVTHTFEIGETVWFRLYNEWVRATVEKLGKVRVGIQITNFPAELKYVSPHKLKKTIEREML